MTHYYENKKRDFRACNDEKMLESTEISCAVFSKIYGWELCVFS